MRGLAGISDSETGLGLGLGVQNRICFPKAPIFDVHVKIYWVETGFFPDLGQNWAAANQIWAELGSSQSNLGRLGQQPIKFGQTRAAANHMILIKEIGQTEP